MWKLDSPNEAWWPRFDRRRMLQRPLRRNEWPSPPPTFRWTRVERFPDVAWSLVAPEVVSERFKRVIEAEGDDVATFLPIRLKGPRAHEIRQRYWYVVWRPRWKCQPDKNAPEIDAQRIPSDERIGMVAGRGWWAGGAIVVRNELKSEIECAGLIGVRFDKVRVITSPTALVRGRNPRTGKREMVPRNVVPHDQHFDVGAFFESGGKANGPGMVPNSTPFLDYVTLHPFMGSFDPAVVRRFLKEGGDPNVGFGPNVTPLVINLPKIPSLIRLAASYGADFTVANSVGVTPLMSAAMHSQSAAVSTLLKLGVSPHARCIGGMTALDYARDNLDSLDPDIPKSAIRRTIFILTKAMQMSSKRRQPSKP